MSGLTPHGGRAEKAGVFQVKDDWAVETPGFRAENRKLGEDQAGLEGRE
jgi:hypothetical protein